MHTDTVNRTARVGAIVLLVLILCGAVGLGNETTIPTILFGRVIDGTGAAVIEDGAVVIEGEIITSVGHRDESEVPAGGTVIDLEGATILPGFINTHVHNSHSFATARRWVSGGVTTVRDLGVPYGNVHWNAISAYYKEDPRMPLVLWAGPLITVPNGYPIVGNNFSSLAVTSPQDARAKTIELIQQGVDVIKVALAIGHGIPGCLSLEEIEAIVDVSHEQGLRVAAHVTSRVEAQRAIEAGADELVHALYSPQLSNEWIARMLENDVSWTPTLAILGGAGGDAVVDFLHAGGIVAMGNDAGYLRGVLVGMPMNEIRAMEIAGMTPMEIIVASTASAARVCQIDDTVGMLRKELGADILVVQGNPLEDLEALDAPLLVYHRGVLVMDSR